MTEERQEREHKPAEAPIVPPPPGSIADTFREVLPDVEFVASQGALDVILVVRRQDILRVIQAAKEDARLEFDYLRCLCGVDQMEAGLEVVYNLYSYKHGHNVTIKTMLPNDDPQVASVTHLWQGALWHERETAEMFGITFQGHPSLQPLLLEEGLGYYPLLKSHPLAEIEEWQEDLIRVEVAPAAVAEAPPEASPEANPPLAEDAPPAQAAEAPAADEKAARIALAQKKAEVIRKAREEARAKGLSPEDERKAVQEALKALEGEE